MTLHFLYKNNPNIIDNWKKAQPKTAELMQFFNKTIGNYPYKQYSVIQGGDGGMEYAMCTLVLGEGKLNGFVGLIAHEMGHSWFQHVLASNESKNPSSIHGFLLASPKRSELVNAHRKYVTDGAKLVLLWRQHGN